MPYPPSWQSLPMRRVMAEFYDGPHATPAPSEDGPIYLGIGNLREDGLLDLGTIRHISEVDYAVWTRRVEPRPGDVVFTYEASLHRYAIIPEGFRGCLGRRTALIRPDPEVVNTKFLLYSFLSPQWRHGVQQRVNIGSTVDRIPLVDFPNFPITLPPLSTQRRIASILSAYDDLIENNTRRIQILEAMAQAIYREWFVEFRFSGHEDVRMVDSALGLIPEGWSVIGIGEVVQTLGGGTPSKAVPAYWEDGVFTWYTPTDLTKSGSMFIERSAARISLLGLSRSSATAFPARAVMMTSRATIGVVSITTVEAATNQGFITCVANERLGEYHLYFWLLANVGLFSALASGATFKEISRSKFRPIPIAVPPPDLERRFHEVIAPIGDLILNLQRQTSNLRSTRDLLLPRLISGEIDVSELDLGDV